MNNRSIKLSDSVQKTKGTNLKERRKSMMLDCLGAMAVCGHWSLGHCHMGTYRRKIFSILLYRCVFILVLSQNRIVGSALVLGAAGAIFFLSRS